MCKCIVVTGSSVHCGSSGHRGCSCRSRCSGNGSIEISCGYDRGKGDRDCLHRCDNGYSCCNC